MRSCTLILKDEVNATFKGLDAETRRLCSAALKFYDPKARHTYAVKMGRWDGRKAFFNAVNGETFINLLDRVLPIIEERLYNIEIEDHRAEFEVGFKPIDENYLNDVNWPEGHRLEGEAVVLEEHQVRIVNALLENQHAIVEAATGAGKCLGYNTNIDILIDENTEFGKFLMNKIEGITGSGESNGNIEGELFEKLHS